MAAGKRIYFKLALVMVKLCCLFIFILPEYIDNNLSDERPNCNCFTEFHNFK